MGIRQHAAASTVDMAWNAGGVAPPHFSAYRVRIGSDGSGSVDFWTDRDLDTEPDWTAAFRCDGDRLDMVMELVQRVPDGGLRPPTHPRVGAQRLDVVASLFDREIAISSDVHPGDLHHVAAVFHAVRACIPEDVLTRLPDWQPAQRNGGEDGTAPALAFGQGKTLIG